MTIGTSLHASLAVLLTVLFAPSVGAQRLATPEDLDTKYACGGGGGYAPETGIQWYREWDGCYVKYPGRLDMPHKMWTVGKMDYRPVTMRGGPSNVVLELPYPGTYQPNPAIIQDIFTGESPHIADTINYSPDHLGNLWTIANEPNWGPLFTPSDYATEFHLYSTYIKGLDPTALIATGGILVSNHYTGPGSGKTPWYEWLDAFRSAYETTYGVPPPVDVWDIHPYDAGDYSGGTSPARKAVNNVIAMRSYLDGSGLQDARITISEVALLGVEDDQMQVDFINEFFSWLNDNADVYKVDKWFWWGSTTLAFGPTGLFDGAYNRANINVKGDAYMCQMRRVFVDPEWTPEPARIKGSMRNPYSSVDEVMTAWSLGQDGICYGDIIYDFSTGQSWVVDFSPSLGGVHDNPDGTAVRIPSGVVTMGNDQLSNGFYVQALDRSSGIRVSGGGISVRTGDIVSVTGEIWLAPWGERFIGGNPTVTVLEADALAPEPMSMAGRQVGGGPLNEYTPGVYGGDGLFNIGLLLTLTGRVTYSDSATSTFYMDDGSGRADGSGHLGVRVQCSGLIAIPVPSEGGYVRVTGVLSTRPIDGKVAPTLRPREPSDLVVY